jgi:hypothetical protein
MFEAEFDKARNLLTLRYAGRVTAADTRRLVGEMETTLADVQPGFRLLTDLSALEAMELACEPDIERMMDFCNQKGVAMVVRVIPDPHKDIGLNIMSLFHYRKGVRLVTCENISEAQRIVEQPD